MKAQDQKGRGSRLGCFLSVRTSTFLSFYFTFYFYFFHLEIGTLNRSVLVREVEWLLVFLRFPNFFSLLI